MYELLDQKVTLSIPAPIDDTRLSTGLGLLLPEIFNFIRLKYLNRARATYTTDLAEAYANVKKKTK